MIAFEDLRLATTLVLDEQYFQDRLELDDGVRESVLLRDCWTCCFCGISNKYHMHVVSVQNPVRDFDNFKVVCYYCWTWLDPFGNGKRKSAGIVLLPEFTQSEIINASREAGVAIISCSVSSKAYMGMLVNDFLDAKIDECKRTVGCDDFWAKSDHGAEPTMVAFLQNQPDYALQIRVAPQSQYIRFEGDHEFNEMPSMRANLRREGGAYYDRSVLKALSHLTSFVDKLVQLGHTDVSEIESYRQQSKNNTTDSAVLSIFQYSGTEKMPNDESSYLSLASKLLNDAANFFFTIGEQNPPLRGQMSANSEVFREASLLLRTKPTELADEGSDIRRNYHLGVQLLRDAAAFFTTIGEQNPSLKNQMAENSEVFIDVARLLEQSPLGSVEKNE